MKKTLCVFFALIFLVSGISTAHAFKVPGLSEAVSGVSALRGGNSQADYMISTYMDASKEYDQAYILALEAFELKKEAEIYKAEAKQFTKGNLNKDPKKFAESKRKASEAAEKAIDEKMKAGVTPTKAGKKKMNKSLGHFGKGILKESIVSLQVASSAEQTRSTITSLSGDPAQAVRLASLAGQLKTLVFLSKNVPGDMSKKKKTLGKYSDYSKAKGIKVPADATNAFEE